MCMWAVTSECRISDSDRARAVMISAARSSSPGPSPQPSGRRRTGPCMGSDYDRTRVLEVIPNTYPILCHLCVFPRQSSCLADCIQLVLQDISYSSPVPEHSREYGKPRGPRGAARAARLGWAPDWPECP